VGEDKDGRLWVSLVTGRVFSSRPQVRNDRTLELTSVRTYGEAEGIAAGFAEVISLRDGVRIGTGSAVLRPRGEGLVQDESLSGGLGASQGAFRIDDASDGGYWVASAKRPVRLTPGAAGLGPRSTALLRIPAGSRILDFLEVSPTELWVGTDDGAYRYNPSADTLAQGAVAAHIRRAQSNETELFSGGPTGSLDSALPHLAPLRFEVSSSSLDDPSRNRFRFRLDGQDALWSAWTAETRKDYTNLGPGPYRFRVQTRDVYGRVGEEAGISFRVLAPWYRKPWAVVLGLGGLAGLFYIALDLRTRTLQKRQRELETIVEQKTAELREASFTDPLTGLRNRRYFAEVIEGEASLAARPGSAALHMFLVDLDHFKQVNDTHGHAAGDEILRQTAARLKTAMRTSDLIFRWGGEEFLIVARGAAPLTRSEIANRIVRMIGKEAFDLGGGSSLPRTCSVGFATFPFYADNPTTVPLDAVIELADLSLYRAKQTGRNRAVGVSPQSAAPAPGDVWKNQVLENLEKGAVSVEVLEGPAPPSP
jgi:diguanylate cyclase (GGDEF)-like protein